jgi:uncharacterized membrane-anchored protein
LGIPYVVTTLAFAVSLGLIFVAWHLSEGTLSIHSVDSPRRELFYWATVIATFALGTAAGDMTAATLHFGYLLSAVFFAVVFVIPAIGYRLFGWDETASFWTAYVITRPLGASVADWLGKPFFGGLGIGDEKVAVVLTILIVIFVAYLAISRKDIKADRPVRVVPDAIDAA